MQKIAILGVGMIGASVAQAVQKNYPKTEIIAFDTNQTTVTIARKKKINMVAQEHDLLADKVDLLIFATPVLITENLVKKLAGQLHNANLISDVGSVKHGLIKVMQQYAPNLLTRLVPSHPIAGREQAGIIAATATLFENQTVILTPLETTEKTATEKVYDFWQGLGAQVEYMNAQTHDEVLSYTSHLPHILSFCLVDYLSSTSDNKAIFHYAASGFKDFTRIAASDGRMWSDISLSNKGNIQKAIDGYIDSLRKLQQAIAAEDAQKLQHIFTNARNARQYFSRIYAMKTKNKDAKTLTAYPSNVPLHGSINIPGDKSMSHRAVMLGALAEGVTNITNILEGEDNLRTLRAFRDMHVNIKYTSQETISIEGVGKDGLKPPTAALDMGNSGTAMRLMSGILVAQPFTTQLVGDASLTRRPMRRITMPLKQMGGNIKASDGDRPPLTIIPSKIHAIDYTLPVASAQVKSAILLAGLYANDKKVVVRENQISRNHTETMMRAFGVEITTSKEKGMLVTRMQPPNKLSGCDLLIPGDISSAAFFVVAALIQPDSKLILKSVGINETRTGLLTILNLMGAKITLENKQYCGHEPIADIHVQSSQLRAIDIPKDQVSLAIDEFPVIFIAAALANGTTRLHNASELRVKESDRLAAMAAGLTTLGISVDLLEDGIVIHGQEGFSGGRIESHGDHRIAMAFAVASLRASEKILIQDADNIATSFPTFVEMANSLGFVIDTGE